MQDYSELRGLKDTINGSLASLRSNFAGTTYPCNPVAGQKFYHTEELIEYIFNGTEWVTEGRSHNHDTMYYTEAEVDEKLSMKSDLTHLHDERYYT